MTSSKCAAKSAGIGERRTNQAENAKNNRQTWYLRAALFPKSISIMWCMLFHPQCTVYVCSFTKCVPQFKKNWAFWNVKIYINCTSDKYFCIDKVVLSDWILQWLSNTPLSPSSALLLTSCSRFLCTHLCCLSTGSHAQTVVVLIGLF